MGLKRDIVVIGGYGHVGGAICNALSELYQGRIYAAGRSKEKAERFCANTGGHVKPLQLNVGNVIDMEWLSSVKLVVMCLDQSDTAFAAACLRSGTHYIDVSANGTFLLEMEKLNDVASVSGATAVISVGLAPGLSNLLVRQARNTFEHLDHVSIGIMLGLGDSHGKAAIEWTVDSLADTFEVMEAGERVSVKSFTDGRTIDFGGGLGKHRAYRFPFSDQVMLPRTMSTSSIATRLCFDSHIATSLVAFMTKLGLTKFFRGKFIRSIVVKAFEKMSYGSDRYALKVDVTGRMDRENKLMQLYVQGRVESSVTASMAAATVDLVYRANLPVGVYHSEQLFELLAQDDRLTLAYVQGQQETTTARVWAEDVKYWSHIK